MNNPHTALIEEKVAEIRTSYCIECDGRGNNVWVGTSGEPEQIPCNYCHGQGEITTLDRVKRTLQATIDTVLEGERERITSVIQERVDYYTNGTGKAGYQITGEYPKTGDERLEMRLQAYFEVNQALTPLPDKE